MIQINLLHKEPNEKCYEILKSTIVEIEQLKKFKIDKNTLLQNLPEEIINEFLNFLGLNSLHRNKTLELIKEGRIILHCWDDYLDDNWRD